MPRRREAPSISALATGPESDRPGTRVGPADHGGSPSNVALKGHYQEYCRQQVSLLLEIIPREAVRPLYRRARIWATRQGLHESKDPMATLRAFCRDVLPLPPFEIWLSDYGAQGVSDVGPELGSSSWAEPMEPVAVEVRRMEHEAEPWHGTLEVYRGGDGWRGFIRFQRDGEERHFRTGEIFCEDNLQDLRNRFISFTAPTLSAFLRSTLP
jgi:hypothetical protein